MGCEVWNPAYQKGDIRIETCEFYPSHFVVRVVKHCDVIYFEDNVNEERIAKIVDFYSKKKS